MKRLWIAAPCLAVMFAALVLTAGSASAAEPEYLECAQVKPATGAYSNASCTIENEKHKGKYEILPAKKACEKAKKVEGHFTGAYEDKACTEANPTHEGKFEYSEGVANGHTFNGASGSAGVYLTVYREEIHCSGGAKDEGLVTGPKAMGKVVLKLIGCVWPFNKAKCTSPGQTAGTIETVPLAGALGYINAAEHEVGVDLAPESGETVATFSCLGGFTLTGSVVMGITGPLNTLTSSFGLYASVLFESQTNEKLEGGETDILAFNYEGGITGAPAPLELAFKNNGENLELKG